MTKRSSTVARPKTSLRAAHIARRQLVTAVICTFERYNLLADAIGSLTQQSLDAGDFRIVVIDNSPDEAASLEHAARWRKVRNLVWHHERKPGLSHARNVAMAVAETPIVSFLDDDAVASQNWLAGKLRVFEQLGADLHVVGGRVRPRFGAPCPSWLGNKMQTYLSVIDLGEETRLLRPGEWVVGANISYRIEPLRAAGGFSTALGRVGGGALLMSNDEIELADRIGAAGGLTAYAAEAEVEHYIPPERLTQQWFRRRVAWQAVSDFVRRPDSKRDDAANAWLQLKTYLAACPPADRTIRALALPQTEPVMFERQMSAVYHSVIAMLGGVDEPDDF